MTAAGLKFDANKIPTHLLSPQAIECALIYKFNNSPHPLTPLEDCFWDLVAWFRGDDSSLDAAMYSSICALAEVESMSDAGCEFGAWLSVAEVLEFGARAKVRPDGELGYGDRNWEKGLEYTRVYAAALRHLLQHLCGQETDAESGLKHLAHMCCCVMFLTHFDATGRKELDDRPCRKLVAPIVEKTYFDLDNARTQALDINASIEAILDKVLPRPRTDLEARLDAVMQRLPAPPAMPHDMSTDSDRFAGMP